MTRRLPRAAAVLLLANAGCPLSFDPTAADASTAAPITTATSDLDPATSEADPTGGTSPAGTSAPTTSTGAPTTGDDTGDDDTGDDDTGDDDTGDDDTGDDDTGPDDGWPDSLTPVVTEVWDFEALDLGDVDGDGRLDLITSGTGYPPRVDVYPGLGDGSFDRDAVVVSELWDFSQFVVADVTGDGRADVLAQGTGYPPRVTVYAGGGDLAVTELATTDVFEFTHMQAGDLTGDGRADLLIGDGLVSWPWLQVWPGTAEGIADAPLFEADPWAFALLRSGDVTGDGRVDVVTASTEFPPQFYIHPGDGDGGFGEPQISEIWDLSWFDLGDLDGDGRADAAADIPNNEWRFQLYLAGADGWSDAGAREGYNFFRFELGDVDGDGRADLVTHASGYPPRVDVYLAPVIQP
ncbi:FG-GAP repeat domain-containing protein [Nannocystis punicea]|uniref:VCBS repeat-containing protein n=1 Tax=Nannocystis punicea TaxID=2995304 RepID=A0ABY7H5L8_9BACT|nr:VCBS repeat-containing protein [Nannocystis poenicansa]WAS94588.1 VCBS repeat-containing protein [Nannocystis poenicansa]